MKFLLLGNGKTIKYVKRFIKYHNDEYIQATFEYENKKNHLLIDESLLELDDIDYVIKSPGISQINQIYLKLKQKFQFISEIDLLSLYKINTKAIVITGSNGKTTFASMLKFLFDKLKIKSIICGNSFSPITKYYKSLHKVNYLIIEQSSFQLHDLAFYKPFIALILNLSANHLDKCYSINEYYQDKRNIYKYQNKQCYFILDDLTINKCNANIVDLLKYDDSIITNANVKKYHKNFDYIFTIFKILNLDTNKISLINNFKILKYRENIIKAKNITFINDSKSTSEASTLFAINNLKYKENTILIIGGDNKKLNYDRLNKSNINTIICYGTLAKTIKKQIKNIIITNTLKEAFIIAININLNNKTILFSPATSSFDQYKNYKTRAKYFNKLIRKYEKNKL